MGSVRPYTVRDGDGKDRTYWRYTFWHRDAATGKPGQVNERFADKALKTRWSSKRACEDAMHADRLARLKPGYVDPSSTPLSAYMEEWFADASRTLSAATIITYRNAWERLEPHLSTITLAKLGPLDIQRAIRTLQDTDYRPGKRYAAGSVALAHIVIGAALDQALKWRLIERNPARGLIVPERDPKVTAIWTRAEARTFLDASRDEPEYALWQLLYDSMMRVGEALALFWEDLDLDGAKVSISKTLTRRSEKAAVVIGKTTKTKDTRTLTLADETVRALRRHRTRQRERRLAAGAFWQESGLVFDRGTGELADTGFTLRRFDWAQQSAGVPRITQHGLRHTAATIAVQEGVPLKLVADRLGHGGLSLVMRLYAHSTEEGDRMVSDALAKAREA